LSFRSRRTIALAFTALALGLAPHAAAQDKAPAEKAPKPLQARRVPFSDDVLPPPPLPVPLDRHLKGAIVAFDGRRIALRWDWSSAEQLDDFEAFVPVRASLDGGVRWSAGQVEAAGTSGLRVRLGFEGDVAIETTATLGKPHDLGLILAHPDTSDESILCLIQDEFFTRFDSSAGNANMINKMGGVPPSAPGMVEFRYVDRKPQPKLARGDVVTFTATRKKGRTTFVIAPEGKREAVTLSGPDPADSRSFEVFAPGLYTSGGSATYGPLTIEGALRPAWFEEHDVLPHVIGDLLHPGNGFKGRVRIEAQVVEDFLAQPAVAPQPKEGEEPEPRVDPERVAGIVGAEQLPLVIRMRAAESLLEKGFEGGEVERSVATLLDADELATRVLAWQVLRPVLPWHFKYEPDGPQKDRHEGALLVAHYLRERDDALAQKKVFVEGYWYTQHRADEIRAVWKQSWDLRTPRVRVRTNLPKEWADWYLAALEACYAEMVARLGREVAPERLPLSLFVFRAKKDFVEFCNGNGYEKRAAWGRFADVEKGVCFVTFDKRQAPGHELGHFAKLFLHAATDRYWPTWYDEGRASWFGDGHRRTMKWNGKVLRVGLVASGPATHAFRAVANEGRLWSTEEFLSRDPRKLEPLERGLWYTHAWALHHFLVSVAPDAFGGPFARWQSFIENVGVGPRALDEAARVEFLRLFTADLKNLDARFEAWVLEALGR